MKCICTDMRQCFCFDLLFSILNLSYVDVHVKKGACVGASKKTSKPKGHKKEKGTIKEYTLHLSRL